MQRFLALRARVAALGALAACAAIVAAFPPAATASAVGCTAVGSGLPWYGLNSAYTCIDIEGYGNTVVSVQGEWFGIGTLCNYRFRIRFRDIHNRLYETDYSPTHVGCRAAGAQWKKNYGVKKKTGSVCVMVQQNGANVGGAPCESIHP
jgi:hypothetical protein